LKEILKNHDKCESKTKDLEHFTVDVHPVHSDSRCFFIVKGNGEKEVSGLKKGLQRDKVHREPGPTLTRVS
jgi:hypothetical protein